MEKNEQAENEVRQIIISSDDISNRPYIPTRKQKSSKDRTEYLSHGGKYSIGCIPSCKRFKCDKKLRTKQLLACSEECAAELIRNAKWVLSVLLYKRFRVKVR